MMIFVKFFLESFNPRAREGRDGLRPTLVSGTRCFNPRAREGRDEFGVQRNRPRSRFNPRAREGRDMLADALKEVFFCFNPRAREGRDCSLVFFGSVNVTFQSTRPRGARHRAKNTKGVEH